VASPSPARPHPFRWLPRDQYRIRGWSAPRYAFKNHSEDIHRIFQSACGALGLRYSVARHVTYISRKADVTRLDEFVGPKA
jgi:hypothetical protein